jgi:hypothetical protein
LTVDGFLSAFHTILQKFRPEKVEIFLFYGKAGFFVSFVKIVCTTLKKIVFLGFFSIIFSNFDNFSRATSSKFEKMVNCVIIVADATPEVLPSIPGKCIDRLSWKEVENNN